MLSGAGEQNVKVLNSPARVYSVSNPAALTISKLTIDNCMCKFVGLKCFFLTVIKHSVINLTPIVAVRLPATIRTGSIVAQPT